MPIRVLTISSLAVALAAAAACIPEPDLAAEDSAERRSTLAWAPCQEDPELECASLVVPLDHDQPRGETLTLAAARAPARARVKRGVVFFNPGGPGGSGIDLLIEARHLFEPLRADFDLVTFDPRGTGRSSDVRCELALPPRASDSLEDRAAFEDEVGRRFVRACDEQHGALAALTGTTHVARDLDAFRAALGEHRLNYIGYSYGTALGASYATQFPDRVRAMVLDANTPPPWLGGDHLLEIDAEGSASAELVLRRLDELCRADTACALHAAGVIATLERVVARLDAQPVAVPGGMLTGSAVTQTVFRELFGERFWPQLVLALALADAGDYGAFEPLPVEPSTAVVTGPGLTTICNDLMTRRPGLDYLPAQLHYHAMYPHFGGVNFGETLAACGSWPRPSVTPVAHAATRHPIVVLGNDFDPSTPISWSRNMASVLRSRARLVRYQGGGHGIFAFGTPCIDDAINAYVRDLIAPPHGLTCPAKPLSFTNQLAAARRDRELPEILRDLTRAPRLRARSASALDR
jgi:pimeloyl-ACP methyl ester carboxylesterase